MVNIQQPIMHTRHVDIKHFFLLNWVEEDKIFMKQIPTTDNYRYIDKTYESITSLLTQPIYPW